MIFCTEDPNCFYNRPLFCLLMSTWKLRKTIKLTIAVSATPRLQIPQVMSKCAQFSLKEIFAPTVLDATMEEKGEFEKGRQIVREG